MTSAASVACSYRHIPQTHKRPTSFISSSHHSFCSLSLSSGFHHFLKMEYSAGDCLTFPSTHLPLDIPTRTCLCYKDKIKKSELPSSDAHTSEGNGHASQRFWTRGAIDENKALVEHLQHYGVIKSRKVAEVMVKIDRGLFVPEGNPAYVDSPMQIGYNATISAPHMHGTCLELLEEHLKSGMHVLDVGSGTGYLTACFAMMVGPQGRAVGVEHIPELVASSIENLKKSAAAPLLKEGSLSVHVADGRLGWPELAPYDAIHVGAAAPEIPQPLIEQLKPGGRMVIPVGNIFQDLQVVDKKADGSISVRSETSVRYVPLTSRASQLHDN